MDERPKSDFEELRLESVIDNAPDGFLVADETGRIILTNATAEAMFGYKRGELVGERVERLIPQRLHDQHLQYRSEYQASPRPRPMGLGLKLLGLRKDGTELPVEISLSPLQTSDRTLVTAIIRDVSERQRLEEERNFLAVELQTEHERDRIAMDLHDGIMQDVYAAALRLELAQSEIHLDQPQIARDLERVIEQLHEVVRNVRSYIFDLRPRQFAGNLADALTDLGREFEQNSHIRTRVIVEDPADIDPAAAVALYHVVHEGLSNVQKHATAKQVEISLTKAGDRLILEIRDNGKGFEPSENLSEQHRGLRNMAARASSIGAEFDVVSAPGQGTCLRVELPLAAGRLD
ncbi:MAG TPA: PAS domain-containing sensor histidine kinase [Dehalococcoidia bacterium]|nr:PAS domain-containing sensor histidine kinase [Dehalococcoidia bacterium]